MSTETKSTNSTVPQTKTAFTSEEMIQKATDWMVKNYGRPLNQDADKQDKFHERAGFLYSFIFDHFPN